jgi:dCTP deaminase
MILTGKEIARQITLGNIVIDPFDPTKVGPNSYNLHLDDKLLVYTELPLRMDKNNPTKEVLIPSSGLLLEPGVLYLGSTVEYTETPQHVPCIEGRSSVGRLGLFVHVTAGFGDKFFRGTWTLELTTVYPLVIFARVGICQISYTSSIGESSHYAGKYQGQRGPKTSGLWQEFVRSP